MNRAEVLDTAKTAVTMDRQHTHGRPEDTFAAIADLWHAYLFNRANADEPLTRHDVAHMMILLKIARAQGNTAYADNYVDMAGYAACAAELA